MVRFLQKVEEVKEVKEVFFFHFRGVYELDNLANHTGATLCISARLVGDLMCCWLQPKVCRIASLNTLQLGGSGLSTWTALYEQRVPTPTPPSTNTTTTTTRRPC